MCSSGFSSSSTAEEVTQGIDGSGLTAIVTGTTHGIGIETSRVLALRGVHVIMAARNVIAANDVKEAILKEIPTAKVDAMELDLSSMESVRKFASEFNSSGLPLNILINNAGICATPFTLSKDNIELQFATNHLGHFLLTNLLLDTMKKTASESKKEGRIINVTSDGHQYTYSEGIIFDKINDESSYQKWHAYGQSKLANILHAKELARCLKEDGVDITANSLHPGAIITNIYNPKLSGNVPTDLTDKLGKHEIKNIQQGAATTCYVALHPQVSGVSGEYFSDSNLAKASSLATNTDLAKKLWDFSMKIIDYNTQEQFRKGISGFSSSSTAEEVTNGIDGSGLTAIVTGATSGIGVETTRVLAMRGVHVIMGVRNMIAAKDVKEAIVKEIPTAKVDAMKLDLSSMASVRKFASEFNSSGLPLNILMSFSINKSVVGYYEENSTRNYQNWLAYGQSKLANLLHGNELARRLKEEEVDITVNSIHPGAVATNVFRHSTILTGVINTLGVFMLKNVQQGAATTCYVALHPQVRKISGQYFSECNLAIANSQGRDIDLAKKLWDFSMNLIK
ncbi:Short-chain dehydrogenase TIC 32, chloroplastic, partial [Mucuna pruriens]